MIVNLFYTSAKLKKICIKNNYANFPCNKLKNRGFISELWKVFCLYPQKRSKYEKKLWTKNHIKRNRYQIKKLKNKNKNPNIKKSCNKAMAGSEFP